MPIGRKPLIAILVAALLWFWMFSPWTTGLTNFWYTMTFSAVALTSLALLDGGIRCQPSGRWWQQLLGGIVLAALLWGCFWVGDKVSSWLLPFARTQVDGVYAMKTGLAPWLIAVLLLTVIGPAEELFWRGYVQERLSRRLGTFTAFAVTTAVYTLIHIWSLNFMLIMAALVAGVVWGFLYWLRPQWLPALVISHALWDALVFVILPI